MATSFNTKTPTPTTQTPSIDLSRFEISSNDSSVSKMTKLTAGSVALSLLGTVEVIKVIIGKILFSLHLKNANSTLDTAKEHFSLIGQNLRKIMRKEETLPLTRSEQKANWLFNKKLWISVGILSLTAFAAYQFAQSDTFARLLQGYSSKPPVPPIDPRTVALTKYSPIPGIDFPLPKPQPSVIECINSKKFPTNLLQSRKIFQCLNVSKDSCTLLYDCPAVKHDFRKLTLLTHPDVAKDMVTSVSQKLNKANEFLRNGFCDTHSKRWNRDGFLRCVESDSQS